MRGFLFTVVYYLLSVFYVLASLPFLILPGHTPVRMIIRSYTRAVNLALRFIGGVGKEVRQTITLRQGIDSDMARKLVKLVKDSKIKVQASIQGDQVRVSGKKRDDLQEAIAMLRKAELPLPLQFTNFRD